MLPGFYNIDYITSDLKMVFSHNIISGGFCICWFVSKAQHNPLPEFPTLCGLSHSHLSNTAVGK